MELHNPNKVPNKEQPKFIGKTKEVLIKKVRFILQDYVDTENILNLCDIIKLENEDADAIVDIKPNLYKNFISKDNTIKPFVEIGQTVIIKNATGQEKGKTYLVFNVRFKKLNNMTVIIADLEETITKEKTFEMVYNLIIKKHNANK